MFLLLVPIQGFIPALAWVKNILYAIYSYTRHNVYLRQ